jgi:DNA-binding transcriptional ArsR family regulator
MTNALAADERLDTVFRALANRTRRAILARLKRGPARVTELAGPFGMSLNAISKHIMVLERAGLVARTVAGREHICALDAAAMQSAEQWLSGYSAFWSASLDSLAAFVEAEEDAE